MIDLHQTPNKLHELSKTTGVHKNHLEENPT